MGMTVGWEGQTCDFERGGKLTSHRSVYSSSLIERSISNPALLHRKL